MANMSNIDSEQIGSAVQQLDEIVAAITNQVAKVREAVDALDKGWVSGVKVEFMSRYRRDEEAMQEMLEQFREISLQLRETAADFDKTESEILSEVSSLR